MTEKPRLYISRLVVKAGKPNGGPAYEVEFTFPVAPTRDEFEDSRKAGLSAIRGWLREKEPIDLADIEALPWKNYQTKQPVGPGHTGWIMWDREGGAELAKAVRESPEQKLKIGPYEISFSGKEKQFLSRKVVEPTEQETTEAPK